MRTIRSQTCLAVSSVSRKMYRLPPVAADRDPTIETVRADLASYPIEPGIWASIVSLFCSLPRRSRNPLNTSVVRGLRPGDAFVLEAYTPGQPGRDTCGP